MHPMAVYCALKGLVPTVRVDDLGGYKYRIVLRYATSRGGLRVLPGEGQYGMSYLWRHVDVDLPHYYKEIPWDEIPESALDRLPQKLVDSLCDSICS